MGAILYAAFGGENLHNRASPEGKQANLASLELRQPPGLTALGAKGSVRDRLTPPGRAPGFRPREV